MAISGEMPAKSRMNLGPHTCASLNARVEARAPCNRSSSAMKYNQTNQRNHKAHEQRTYCVRVDAGIIVIVLNFFLVFPIPIHNYLAAYAVSPSRLQQTLATPSPVRNCTSLPSPARSVKAPAISAGKFDSIRLFMLIPPLRLREPGYGEGYGREHHRPVPHC